VLKFDNPERVFISSDFHFHHKQLCKGISTWPSGGQRDFPDEISMTDKLIENINSKISPEDILIHLGDWSFNGKDKVKLTRDKINCKKIVSCKGNHDTWIVKDSTLQSLFWKWYGDDDTDPIIRIKVNGKTYICGHYAMKVWENSHHGWRHLYGHSHNSLTDDPNSLSFDVGVDCHNLFPLSFVEVEEIMSKKEYKPVDHHK